MTTLGKDVSVLNDPSQEATLAAGWAKVMSSIIKVKRAVLPQPSDLQSIEEELYSLMSKIPDQLQPDATSHLSPSYLAIAALACDARLMLHRLGLNPLYNEEQRVSSLETCTSDARLTAQAVWRGMPAVPNRPTEDSVAAKAHWDAEILVHTPWYLCRHLWRCIIVLCTSLDFEGALTCAGACEAVGDKREVNAAHGHSLVKFLERLRDKMLRGDAAQLDEEMLVYASTDLQDEALHGWALQDGPIGVTKQSPPTGDIATFPMPQTLAGYLEVPEPWKKVRNLLTQLRDMDQPQATSAVSAQAPHSAEMSGQRARGHGHSLSVSSRMSIASLTGPSEPRGEG